MADDYSKWHASDEEVASFHKAPFNFADARRKMVARVERTIAQLKGDAGGQGGRDYDTLHNNGVLYKPTLNGRRISLPGEKEEHGGFAVVRDKLFGLLDQFKEAIHAGKHDADLEAAMTSSGEQSAPARTPRASTGAASGSYSATGFPSDHPKMKDPAGWAGMSKAERITAGLAYKKNKKG